MRTPFEWLKIQPASARLVQSQDDLQNWRADGTAHTAENKAVLNLGPRLKTGADGFAIIEFTDGSRVRIRAQSELALDGLSAYGKTGMVDWKRRLNSGRVENMMTKKRLNPSRYEISTPTAIAAVRGTEFRVGAGARV